MAYLLITAAFICAGMAGAQFAFALWIWIHGGRALPMLLILLGAICVSVLPGLAAEIEREHHRIIHRSD